VINQILISSHFKQFIQEAIAHGRYKSKSEVVWSGLWLLKEDEAKVKALNTKVSF